MGEWTKQEKKSLLIFGLTAFALPYALGIVMGLSFFSGNDVSVFPSMQMYAPAAGAILAMMFTHKGDRNMPRKFFICILTVSALMVLCAVGSAVIPDAGLWLAGSNLVMIAGSLAAWVFYFLDGKERRKAYGLRLTGTGGTNPLWIVLLFIALYFVRVFGISALWTLLDPSAAAAAQGEVDAVTFWINLLTMPLSFLLAFTPFFGEEYGWRGFLQPLLQKRFGPRAGVIVLGVLWGVWHLPINVFYYSPETWHFSLLQQIFVCISYSVFFGFAYARTRSIWTAVIIHFFNNNAILLFAAPDAISNQVLDTMSVALNLIVMCVLYLPFLLSKTFRTGVSALPQTQPEPSEQ